MAKTSKANVDTTLPNGFERDMSGEFASVRLLNHRGEIEVTPAKRDLNIYSIDPHGKFQAETQSQRRTKKNQTFHERFFVGLNHFMVAAIIRLDLRRKQGRRRVYKYCKTSEHVSIAIYLLMQENSSNAYQEYLACLCTDKHHQAFHTNPDFPFLFFVSDLYPFSFQP